MPRDSFTVVFGFLRTVDCFTYRPLIAERPVLPEPPLFLPAISFTLPFRAFAVGLD